LSDDSFVAIKFLQDAYFRIERAKKHLAELEGRIEAVRKGEKAFSASIEADPSVRLPVVKFGAPIETVCRLLTGEIVYNLRAALDYLVYDLALWNTGKPREGTQFPINKSAVAFERNRKTSLKGLNVEHVAMIEQVQPYKGCKWTDFLNALSNADKHRKLTVFDMSGSFTMNLAWIFPVDPQAKPGTSFAAGTMQMNPNEPFFVAFEDGRPIVETLKKLHLQVARLLDLFKASIQ
jgi:hypothetical protein